MGDEDGVLWPPPMTLFARSARLPIGCPPSGRKSTSGASATAWNSRNL